MQTILKYVCLSGLVVTLPPLIGCGVWKIYRCLMAKDLKRFKTLPILAQVFLIAWFFQLFVFASTKTMNPPTGGGDGGGSTNAVEVVEGGSTNMTDWVEGGETNQTDVVEDETPTNPPTMMAMGPRRRTTSVQQQGFTAEQIAAGIVMTLEGSNEVWSAEPPEGATIIGDWVKHGAFDDWVEIRDEVWGMRDELVVYSQGRVLRCVSTSNGVETVEMRMLEGLGIANEVVSVLPECRWGTNGPSRVWYMKTEIGSVVVGWQNALLGRDANGVVGIVGEFYHDGNWRVKYDWSRLGAEALLSGRGTNDVAQMDLGWTNVTSRFFHKLRPRHWQERDCDGDGISTHDELFVYHTSPDLYDTDGDMTGDAEEISEGRDPLLSELTNEEIVGTVAGWPTNETMCAVVPSDSGEAEATMLWNRFAADWVGRATNVVWERTVEVDRKGGLQQYFLSSKPDAAGGWALRGMRLEWVDEDGCTGSAAASPEGDSFYLPVCSNDPQRVTLRLVATGRRVRAFDPVYLVAYAPRIDADGEEIVSNDAAAEQRTFAYADGGGHANIGLTFDRANRPCFAALYEGERSTDWAQEMARESGGALSFAGSPENPRLVANTPGVYRFPTTCGGGLVVIVLDPSIGYGDGHCSGGLGWDGSGYYAESSYPLDSACLRREWHRDADGWDCACEPWITSGVDEGGVTTELYSDGETAWGYVLVGDVIVWTGSAEHHRGWADEGGIEEEGCCNAGCANGDCAGLEGIDLGSLKFRIPLGEFRQGQVAGFVWFGTEEGIAIAPDVFSVTRRRDVAGTDTANGTVRTITADCERGKDVCLERIAGGVRATVRPHGRATELDHLWEITNEGGSRDRVRFRKVSKLDNVMEEHLVERVFDPQTGKWRWQALDVRSGIREELVKEDGLADGGTLREVRNKYAADGRWLGGVERVRTRIGERDNAVLRETLYRECTGQNTIVREAGYWEDSEFPARNGRLRLLTATDRPWEYHEWNHTGLEVVRVEQKDGAGCNVGLWDCEIAKVVEWGNGEVRNWGSALTGIRSAYLTTFDYSPLPGDECGSNETHLVRCESKYVVRDGDATLIGRTWRRYTHGTSGGWPTVREETWRAGDAPCGWNDGRNAYSCRVTFDDNDAGGMPFALRGREVEALDEDGRRTVHAVTLANGVVTDVARSWFGEVALPTCEVTEFDATHGVVLRRATLLADCEAVIAEERSAYDDQNRLRLMAYLDGTAETNAYSCCRKLWSTDREGRRTLRSAVTGEDTLYWADEDVWLRAFGTGGVHRVTQHFCDGFGRETNTVVYVAATEGEATDWTASDGRRLCENRAAYAGTGADCFEEIDRKGKRTTTRVWKSATCEVTEVVEDGGESTRVTNRTTEVRNGSTTVRKCWGGKWIETETATDYDANGCRVVTETERASDHEPVVKSVETCDFLGRTVSRTTPMGTTATVYDGTSSRVVSESRVVDGTTRTVVSLYDETGELVGTAENGVERRSEVEYREWSNEWWRVERNEKLKMKNEELGAEVITNYVEETWTQLTGLGNGLRSRVRRVERSGVETVTSLEEGDEPGVTVETEASSVKSPVVRVKRYGLVVEERSGDVVTAYEYDGLGRVVGKTTSVQQQAGGDASQPETVKEERFGYDNCDQLVSASVLTNGAVWVERRYAYDAFGRTAAETDAEGNTVTATHDAAGAVIEVAGAANPVRYGYDSSGRRTSLGTTRNGVNWDDTEWEYDAGTGLCVAKEYANGSRQTMTYAGDGQLLRKTLPSGKWTQNAYDGAGRLVGIASSDGRASVSFENNEFGEVTEETGLGYAYGYVRAENGVVTNETLAIGNEAATIRRAYDEFGRLARREVCTSRAGQAQTIEYDSENRIGAISGDVARVEYRYSALGSDLGYTLRVAGGATVSREVTVDERTGRIHAVSNRVNGTLVDVWEYGRDGDGRILRRNADSFAYDEKGQVVSACVGEVPAGYGYDAAGNFSVCTHGTNGVVRTFTANALNQYTAADGATLATTPDGGVSRWGGWTFAYDSEERLSAASGAAGANVANFYDSKGRRIRKSADDGEHLFFWDGWNPALEVIVCNGETNVVEYGWGKDVEGSLELAGGVGALLWVRVDGRVYVPLYDGNGNVTAYVGESGTVVARFQYGAFGEETNLAMNGEAQNADVERLRFRYSTKYVEPENGLVYFAGRFYCPALGRWMSRDPAGEDAGANLYVFCRNAPTWLYDVLGALTNDEVVRHWREGSGTPLSMSFSEIDTGGLEPGDFPAVSDLLGVCAKGNHKLRFKRNAGYTKVWHVSGAAALFLGDITLRLLYGNLDIRKNGDWEFSGAVCSYRDTYDFDMHSPWWNPLVAGRNLLTLGGRFLAGPGTAFKIVISGSKPLSGSGNCCSRSWRWW